MSGFEHYARELADIDREIAHWASVCGVDPADAVQLRARRAAPRTPGGNEAAETLRGLLLLRLKLETEMIELGLSPDGPK